MIGLLNSFLVLHLLVILAGASSLLLRWFVQKNHLSLKGSTELRMNYALLVVCLILSTFVKWPENQFTFQPIAKVISAKTYREFEQRSQNSKLVIAKNWPAPSADQVFSSFAVFFGCSLILGLGLLFNNMRRLRNIFAASIVFRQIGRIRVAISDDVQVPFSARLHHAWVVVPSALIADPAKLKISLLHELQHHRQQDTLWIYLLFLFRAILFLNPLMWLWARVIAEVQELACDEKLVDQGKVNRREYARSLIEIAETAVVQRGQPACAAGLAFLNDRQTISRRIESMFIQKTNNWLSTAAVSAVVFLGLAATAFASRALVHDRRVTMADAQRMARAVKSQSQFPIVVNEHVLKQLNRYLGTEQGREFVKESLQRLQSLRKVFDAKVEKYHMPAEILAVGLVESGYRNLPQSENSEWGAGIWMFIESTARNFGLRVEPGFDDRLDIEKETEAAMRYLGANQLRFQNWQLAIMAYNIGEENLQNAFKRFGTRDPWKLIDAGVENDKDYLARVMAAVLILSNPQVL